MLKIFTQPYQLKTFTSVPTFESSLKISNMVSEAASTTNRRSQADEAPRGSQAAQGMNRPPRGRGHCHINRNVQGNASNLGNPAHSGPSQEGNAGDIGDNRDAIDHIN